MRVLINCLSSSSGGAIAYLRHLVPALAERFAASDGKHEAFALAHADQVELWRAARQRVPTILAPKMRASRRLVWEWQNLQRLVETRSIDVVFTPYQLAPPVKRARSVVMLRNMEPFFYDRYRYSARPRLRNWVLRKASIRSLQRADLVIGVSRFSSQFAASDLSIDASRITTIYHGRDTEIAEQGRTAAAVARLGRLGITGEFVLSAGSQLPYRRFEDVVAAFSRCAHALGAHAQLVIAGSGADRAYADLIRDRISASGVATRIRSLGQVPYEDMKVLYPNCRIYVAASEIEACPNSLIEAMSGGCAIIAANTEPLPEVLAGAGVLFRPRDTEDLARKIESIWRDAELRTRLSNMTLARAASFSWNACADRTYEVLTQDSF